MPLFAQCSSWYITVLSTRVAGIVLIEHHFIFQKALDIDVIQDASVHVPNSFNVNSLCAICLERIGFRVGIIIQHCKVFNTGELSVDYVGSAIFFILFKDVRKSISLYRLG